MESDVSYLIFMGIRREDVDRYLIFSSEALILLLQSKIFYAYLYGKWHIFFLSIGIILIDKKKTMCVICI